MGFNIAKTNKKRVVIIGGGFGGVKLANKLKGSNFQVVLIDKNNFHQFPPLLYQVASSGLEPGSIIFPFRKIFQKQKDFYFRMAEVKAIIAERNLIETSIGELTYDYLVIASGTITNFFGNQDHRRKGFADEDNPGSSRTQEYSALKLREGDNLYRPGGTASTNERSYSRWRCNRC